MEPGIARGGWQHEAASKGGAPLQTGSPIRTYGIKRPGDSSVTRWFWCWVGIDSVTDHVDDEDSATPLQDHFAPSPPPPIAVLSVHVPV